MAGLRTIADRAGIGRCSGAGPHWPASPAIAGCAQLDPLEMAHVAVVVGARSGDFERWDHCSQITSEGLDRPRLVSVVLGPQAPIAEMVRNRDLVTNADLQRSRTNAATGETKSCNAKMVSVDDFGSVNFP